MQNKRKNGLRNLFILMLIGCIPALFLANTGCCGKNIDNSNDVKLVLMVTIDQLRADIVTRLENRLGEGGFKYLIDNGLWYKNARYEHVTTITAVGHATLFTGASPAGHGIVGNYWFDRQTGEVIKSIEGKDPHNPDRKLMGPMQLTSTTIGDELALGFDHQSRVFSVSVKDRGAILPGGYLGKAFWYNRETGGFRTGEYYYKKVPQWLTDWNNLKKADSYKTKKWELMHDKSTYIFKNSDDRPEEKPFNEPPKYNRSIVFPHTLDKYKNPEYYSQLCYTPFGDDLTVDFACHVLETEKLGGGAFTDMLTVSLSVTDLIGHVYGPNSLEYEDNLLHVDAALAKLFRFVDEKVGLNRTLIVVTGDHGVDLNPEYRKRFGMPAGRVNPEDFKTAVNRALKDKFNLKEDKNFVFGFRNPSVYLDPEAVKTLKADPREVEAIAAEAVMNDVPGIAYAASRTDMMQGKMADSLALRRLKSSFHPQRSGDIMVLQKPFWFLYHVHDEDVSMHGAPYSYDSHVPLFFAGPGIRRGEVYRPVCPRDIAATVA
jgi:predicted AlkP superfamily pyrophosphatase or phosphodiesterase